MKNSNKLKVLCLSFWTPPLVRPQAILIGKMIPEWKHQGLDPIIITYDICGEWGIDAPIYKIPQFLFPKNRFKNLLARYLYYRKIFKITKKIIKKHQINLVFSFSNPQESNILGAMLKKKLGIKFISHFSDPYLDNPYKNFSLGQKIKVACLEKFIIKNSDRIIFTNDQARNLVLKKYPADWLLKTKIIPHCYNPADYEVNTKKENNQFIISYIGAFYKQRNPEILFQALNLLIKEYQEIRDKINLSLVGVVNDYADYNLEKIKGILEKYQLDGITTIIPPLSYQKSLEYIQRANCLIMIDANLENSPFLPSKLIDYAPSKNLIIGITPKGSPSDNFLTNLGYKTFAYEHVDELSNYLKNVINNKEEIKINQNFLDNFSVRNTSKELIKVFQEVLNL